jgi:hypothetical protein
VARREEASVIDWRKIPQIARPYDAYNRGRYVEDGCDHHGPYCKCDPPFHLRASSPAEEAIAARLFGPQQTIVSGDA